MKKIIAICTIITLIFTMSAIFSLCAAGTDFAGGNGSEQNPYLISDKAQLDNVRRHLGAHFKMINDINFSKNDVFVPIGTIIEPFYGTFDGGGFSINKIKISLLSDTEVYAGVFGYNEGTVRNLSVKDADISALSPTDEYTFAGAVAGDNVGTIESCSVSGKVKAVMSGGIAGENFGTITDCKNECTVTSMLEHATNGAHDDAGGIAGYNLGRISDCRNYGFVAAMYAGGIVGHNYGEITECINNSDGAVLKDLMQNLGHYNAGGITGFNEGDVTKSANKGALYANHIGGIVGYQNGGSVSECYNEGSVRADNVGAGIVYANKKGSVTNCYNVGDITAVNNDLWQTEYEPTAIAAGIVGYNSDSVTNCYNVGKLYAKAYNPMQYAISYRSINCYALDSIQSDDDVARLTIGQMQNAGSFSGFDFENVWTMDGCVTYDFPKLKNNLPENFTDVKEGAWYYEFVNFAAENGIFSGKGNRTFEPYAAITRAEFVQVLANISDEYTSGKVNSTPFSDVAQNAWYASAVSWAYERGITSGIGNGKFAPNDIITREQMCVMLMKYAENKNIPIPEKEKMSVFSDDGKISAWAKSAVYKCQMSDIINGKGGGIFDPSGNAARCEAATVFTHFYREYIN